jgi:hypothetical protein
MVQKAESMDKSKETEGIPAKSWVEGMALGARNQDPCVCLIIAIFVFGATSETFGHGTLILLVSTWSRNWHF